MLKWPTKVGICMAFASGVLTAQPAVQVDASHVQGPRPLEDQTKTAAVRGYLKSWQSMSDALVQNRVELLDADFVGAAKDRLTDTIGEQIKLGIQTRYQDRAHHIQFVFYSPEGLSIEMIDQAEYDVQLIDHGKTISTVPVSARYIVVLTPAEVQWRVRLMQAESDETVRQGFQPVPGSTVMKDKRGRTQTRQGM